VALAMGPTDVEEEEEEEGKTVAIVTKRVEVTKQ